MISDNLYVHFPFCRRKCAYCSLYSKTCFTEGELQRYVENLIPLADGVYKTVYFGGGTPMLCDIPKIACSITAEEFTVEVHPLDVSVDSMKRLADCGVNRISMGVQSLSGDTLERMNRHYSLLDAATAFETVKKFFSNAGIDLIVGFPGDETSSILQLKDWGLAHLSIYSLQNERNLQNVPSDDELLDKLNFFAEEARSLGLARYEISNFAKPGCECRHNLAIWRGEDYIGLGEGAFGRIGRKRTISYGTSKFQSHEVSEKEDSLERTIFRLRTSEGLDTSAHPEWRSALDAFVAEGLLTEKRPVYFLTDRGREVCDSILAELI